MSENINANVPGSDKIINKFKELLLHFNMVIWEGNFIKF